MTTPKRVVVDTNVLMAFVDEKDKWHPRAYDLMATLAAEKAIVIYFDCVMNETISLMARRSEEQKRSDQLQPLFDRLFAQAPKEALFWISNETERLFDDIVMLIRHTNGVLNFHDALMALACREINVQMLLSFDKDFDQIAWLSRIETTDVLQRALDTTEES